MGKRLAGSSVPEAALGAVILGRTAHGPKSSIRRSRRPALYLVTSVDLRRRSRRLEGREALRNPIAVLGSCRYKPRIPRLQVDRLSLNGEFGSARNHVAHSLVIAPDWLVPVGNQIRT